MKKRIVSLLLALAVLCTGVMLIACNDETGTPLGTVAQKSVSEVINEAMEKTGSLDSMSATMKMEMNMAMEGMTMSVPITAKIKAKDMQGDNAVASIVITMSMFGQEINMEIYQEGQWAYVAIGDMKYKADVKDLEGELDYANSANDMLKEIPEELLKDVELVKAEDGSQTATIAFTAEKFAEIYDELIATANSETGAEMEEVKIAEPVVKITVANDYVTVCDIAFSLEAAIEGMNTTTEVKATLTYENPGEPVTVTPPEGYLDFEEMDDDLLGLFEE